MPLHDGLTIQQQNNSANFAREIVEIWRGTWYNAQKRTRFIYTLKELFWCRIWNGTLPYGKENTELGIESIMRNRQQLQYMLVFAMDLFALGMSTILDKLVFGTMLRRIPAYTKTDYLQFVFMLVIAFLVAFSCFNQDTDIVRLGWKMELIRVVEYNAILATTLAFLLIVFKSTVLDSRYLYLGIFAVNVPLTYLSHYFLKNYLRSKHSAHIKKLVGVLSTKDRVQPLVRDLKRDWSKNVIGVALVDASKSDIGSKVEGVPVRAVYEEFMAWVRRDALDEIYINLPYDTGDSLVGYLTEMESMGLDIHFNSPLLEKMKAMQSCSGMPAREPTGLVSVGGVSMITVESVRHSMRDLTLKRLMDIAGGLVGCIISIPIIAVVAIPLKLESPGPLFFKQRRVGLNGRYFTMYKLRSMYADAEERKKELMAKNEMNGLMFKMEDDPRITKVGKFIRKTSIDELPQFINVLCGQMSLVGTRPPTVDEYRQYESHHKRRLSMKPGITGMWQACGRSNIENFEDVVRMDVEYIDNWSLKLDIQLLFKTIGVVFTGKGAK